MVLQRSKQLTSCSSSQRLGIESVPLTRMLREIMDSSHPVLTSRHRTLTGDLVESTRAWVARNSLLFLVRAATMPLRRQPWTQHHLDQTPPSMELRHRLQDLVDQLCHPLCTAATPLRCLQKLLCHHQPVQSVPEVSKNWESRSYIEIEIILHLLQ